MMVLVTVAAERVWASPPYSHGGFSHRSSSLAVAMGLEAGGVIDEVTVAVKGRGAVALGAAVDAVAGGEAAKATGTRHRNRSRRLCMV